jgi:hypothetical protein
MGSPASGGLIVRSDTVQWAEDDSKSQSKLAKSIFFNPGLSFLSHLGSRRPLPYRAPHSTQGVVGLTLPVWNNLHFAFGADLNPG